MVSFIVMKQSKQNGRYFCVWRVCYAFLPFERKGGKRFCFCRKEERKGKDSVLYMETLFLSFCFGHFFQKWNTILTLDCSLNNLNRNLVISERVTFLHFDSKILSVGTWEYFIVCVGFRQYRLGIWWYELHSGEKKELKDQVFRPISVWRDKIFSLYLSVSLTHLHPITMQTQ